jgi:hypothetical protein
MLGHGLALGLFPSGRDFKSRINARLYIFQKAQRRINLTVSGSVIKNLYVALDTICVPRYMLRVMTIDTLYTA